jgi:hypothetical protein
MDKIRLEVAEMRTSKPQVIYMYIYDYIQLPTTYRKRRKTKLMKMKCCKQTAESSIRTTKSKGSCENENFETGTGIGCLILADKLKMR